jgi:uncharacterized protein YgbK (DUF1537 family)
VVVPDDDPLGTQAAHDAAILTRWDAGTLAAALNEGEAALFVLTNSRSLPAEDAVALNRALGAALADAGRACGRPLWVVSRSDSTLRGHFPAEVDALRASLAAEAGAEYDAVCLVPCFPEAGRFTIGGVHWVVEGEMLVPAAQTPYARDRAFGYQCSHLPSWVEERTDGRVLARDVLHIPLEVTRRGGPDAVAKLLAAVSGGRVVTADAVSYADLDLLVAGFRRATEAGKRFLYRATAPFVKALAGMPDRPLLAGAELPAGRAGGGLILFGSHVPKSTAQLARAAALPGLDAIELRVPRVLDPDACTEEVARVAALADAALAEGRDALVFTSRAVAAGVGEADGLAIARTVSAAVVAVVEHIRREPRFLVGKGGITSSDLATRALGARKARVLGQVLLGVPVWQPGPGSRWPAVPFVIFPGNVGAEEDVARVILALREG